MFEREREKERDRYECELVRMNERLIEKNTYLGTCGSDKSVYGCTLRCL